MNFPSMLATVPAIPVTLQEVSDTAPNPPVTLLWPWATKRLAIHAFIHSVNKTFSGASPLRDPKAMGRGVWETWVEFTHPLSQAVDRPFGRRGTDTEMYRSHPPPAAPLVVSRQVWAQVQAARKGDRGVSLVW